MWVFKYFITVFTSSFPVNIAIYIWDFLLLHGFENIYKVLLSLLKIFQEKLLKLSGFEIITFFNNLQSDQLIPQRLIQKALKIKFHLQLLRNQQKNVRSIYGRS